MYTACLLALQTETDVPQTTHKYIYSPRDAAVGYAGKTSGKNQHYNTNDDDFDRGQLPLGNFTEKCHFGMKMFGYEGSY
jgi:hypothetical protein